MVASNCSTGSYLYNFNKRINWERSKWESWARSGFPTVSSPPPNRATGCTAFGTKPVPPSQRSQAVCQAAGAAYKNMLGSASSTCACPFALSHTLTWPIACGNGTGLNDPILLKLPPTLSPFQKQSPFMLRFVSASSHSTDSCAVREMIPARCNHPKPCL